MAEKELLREEKESSDGGSSPQDSSQKSEKSSSLEDFSEKIDELREQMMSSLTEIEKDVLSVAEEILKLKRFDSKIEAERIETVSPMVDEIYQKSKAKFKHYKGYEDESIFQAIKSLEDKKWIITGQRVTKDEVLSNPIKKEILSFIEKYPGIHARDDKIQEFLHITRNPFIKHMASLEAFELVRSSKIGATLNYFPADLPEVFDDLCVLFQNEIVVNIIKMYIEDSRVTLMEMAEEIGVYHRAIQYHIKALKKHNILIKIPADEVKLRPGEKLDRRRKYYKINDSLLLRYNKLFKIPPFTDWFEQTE